MAPPGDAAKTRRSGKKTAKGSKGSKGSKDTKDTKDPKDSKGSEDSKGSKDSKDSKGGSKSVVPALPLPFVQRRAAAGAAAAAAAATAAASTDAASPVTPVAAAKTLPQRPRNETALTNGTAEVNHKEKADGSPPAPTPVVSPPHNRPTVHIVPTEPKLNAQVSPVASSAPSPDQTSSTVSDAKIIFTPDDSSQPTTEPTTEPTIEANVEAVAQAPNPQPPIDKREGLNGTPTKKEMRSRGEGGRSAKPWPGTGGERLVDHRPRDPRPPMKGRPPPTLSPTQYHMAPGFQAQNRPIPLANGDPSRLPRHHVPGGPPHVHQPHPSNGSIHFGAFHGSTSSSPAPPLSGGIAPPPGMPISDGRPPYIGHPANGFPPMAPFASDMTTSFDSYGRPVIGYSPHDSYPPHHNNFGQATPHSHSFHNSPASVATDDAAIQFAQHATGPTHNGIAAPLNEHPSQTPQGRQFDGPDYQQAMAPPRLPPGLPPPMLHDNGGIETFMRQQFGNPEFSDCVLEVHISTPSGVQLVAMNGHRLILGRSPKILRELGKTTSTGDVTNPPKSIKLETVDKWIRSDALWSAVHHLYGQPLLTINPNTSGTSEQGIKDNGYSANGERVRYALAYAASGHFLEWPSIEERGVRIVAGILDWPTLDIVMEFALEDHCDRGSHSTYKYGVASQFLLDAVVRFIAENMPLSFNLVTNFSRGSKYHLLPNYPSPNPSPTAEERSLSGASSAAVRLRKSRRSQQISGIRFGDLTPADTIDSSPATTETSGDSHMSIDSVLSRVLLNLPFPHLHVLFEALYTRNTHNRWAENAGIVGIVKAVQERELRRRQAVSAVKDGLLPNWEQILTQLASPEPRCQDPWAVVGWHEEVSFPRPGMHGDRLRLVRNWVPLAEPTPPAAVAEYP